MNGARRPAYVLVLCARHSGSTLFERVLAASGPVLALGELARLESLMANPREICGCGETVQSCGFWRQVAAANGLAVPGDWPQVRVRRFGNAALSGLGLWMTLRSARSSHRPLFYANYVATNRQAMWRQREMVRSALAISGQRVVIDKSMSASRLGDLLLGRFDEVFDLHVAHLVRRPEDVVASIHRRGHRVGRGIRDWLRSNAAIRWVIERAGTSFQRVSYERLCSEPDAVIAQLGNEFGLPLQFDPARFPEHGHAIGGNVEAREIGFGPIDRRESSTLLTESQRRRVSFWCESSYRRLMS